MSVRTTSLAATLLAVLVLLATVATAWAVTPAESSRDSEIEALKAEVATLRRQSPPPELGQQMLNLQIRHDRLWWAGQAGNWNLAYFMIGELNEALQGIEESNGDAPQLQPQKLSEVMPSIMNPAIKDVQEALARHDRKAFAKAYDRLSTSCTACHQVAGASFLVIQRPKTKLLDNLRYAPPAEPAQP